MLFVSMKIVFKRRASMKAGFLNFCYQILIKTKANRIISYVLSKRILYSSTRSLKEEFGGSYNVITTLANSTLLGSKTIGSCYCQSGYWENSSYDYCVLRSLWVHPLLKRRGVGQKIVANSIENVKSAGFKYIMLLCISDNVVAKALYEKVGFNDLKTSHHLDGDYHYQAFENERLYLEGIIERPVICFWINLNSFQ